jgi:hypothetical protein
VAGISVSPDFTIHNPLPLMETEIFETIPNATATSFKARYRTRGYITLKVARQPREQLASSNMLNGGSVITEENDLFIEEYLERYCPEDQNIR